MSCPRCSSQDIGTIRFAVIKAGVSFQYCRRCEHRWWEGSGSTVQLSEVLQAASVLARAS